MAVFRIERINYVIAGSVKEVVNVNVSRLDNAGAVVGEERKNVSFFPECSFRASGEDPARTHRIRVLDYVDDSPTKLDLSGNIRDYQYDNQQTRNLIYDLFDAKDLVYGSDIFSHNFRISEDVDRSGTRITNSREKLDYWAPPVVKDPVGFVQADKQHFIGLLAKTQSDFILGHTTLWEDRGHRLSNDSGKMIWNNQLSSQLVDTFTYTPLSDLRKNSFDYGDENYDPNDEKYRPTSEEGYYGWMKSFEELSAYRLSTLFDPKYDLVNLVRNFMLEFRSDYPNDDDGFHPDFNEATMDTVTMYNGKNPYNAEYSMEMPSISSIMNTREYVGIGQAGGNQPFLKYFDDFDYRLRNLTQEEKDAGFPLPALSSSEVQNLEMVEVPTLSADGGRILNFQKIEFMESNNRGLNSSKHKSNLYSIQIRNTGLNPIGQSPTQNPELIAKIRTDIQNTVRKIAEKLQPAHTQLFNVSFGQTDNIRDEAMEEKVMLDRIEVQR